MLLLQIIQFLQYQYTIEQINTFISAWNPEREIEMGLFRVPVPDFNRRAIREAIVNAFSHRDYTKMGRVRIAITDEGLTIANPGGFIEGVSIKNLLAAEPHGRNPQLADALKRIGLAEKTGRGIDRIYEGSLLFGKPLPDYSASTAVTVSLSIPRSKPDIQIAQLVSNWIGTWTSSYQNKKNKINNSHLNIKDKESLKNLLDILQEKSKNHQFENSGERGTIGMFGTGFFTFSRVSKDDARKFIELCIEISKINY